MDEEKKKFGPSPANVEDAVANLRWTALALKSLWAACNVAVGDDLYATRRMTELVIVDEIKNLNTIAGDLAKNVEGLNYEPVELK